MRLHFYKTNGETTTLDWPMLLGFVILVPAVVVGLTELFWLKFTGGYSPLMAGFAFVASLLILLRVVGASVAHEMFLPRSTQ